MSLSGPGRSPRSLPVGAGDLLLILIITLGSARLVAALLGAMLHPGEGAAAPSQDRVLILTLVLILLQSLVMLGAVWLVVLRKYGLAWADLGLRPVERRWYRLAPIIAVVLLPAVGVINTQIQRLAGESFQNPQIYAIAPAGFNWLALVGMIALAGVVAPFAEELAFRGVLYPWLRQKLGVAGAAVLSGLCFAALHGVVWLVPALLLVGVALALIYERSGSLWPAVITHGVFNSIMIVVVYAALSRGVQIG